MQAGARRVGREGGATRLVAGAEAEETTRGVGLLGGPGSHPRNSRNSTPVKKPQETSRVMGLGALSPSAALKAPLNESNNNMQVEDTKADDGGKKGKQECKGAMAVPEAVGASGLSAPRRKPRVKPRVYKWCHRCWGMRDERLDTCKTCRRVFHPSCISDVEDQDQAGAGAGAEWECPFCASKVWKCIGCQDYGPITADAEVWCGNTDSGRKGKENKCLDEKTPGDASDEEDDEDPTGNGDDDNRPPVMRCSAANCLVYYHHKCLPKECLKAGKSFKCNAHVCGHCANDPMAKQSKVSRGRLKRCVECITSFHMPRCGLLAVDLQSDFYMVCSEHKDKYAYTEKDDQEKLIDSDYIEHRVLPTDFMQTAEASNSEKDKDKVAELLDKGTLKPGVWRIQKQWEDFGLSKKLKLEVDKLREKEALRRRPAKYQKINKNRYLIPTLKKPTSGYRKGEEPICDCKKNRKGDEAICKDGSCHNRAVRYECYKPTCSPENGCKNHRLRNRQWTPHVIKPSPQRGFGFFCKNDVKEDDLIIEYIGEIIDEPECTRRMKKMHEDRARNYYFLKLSSTMIIDATVMANDGRFMNHSCNPNCVAQVWIVDGLKRVGLYAKHDIPADTELTWNYNFGTVGEKEQACQCGAPNCSGIFGGRPLSMDEMNGKKRKRHALESHIRFHTLKEAASYVKKVKAEKPWMTENNKRLLRHYRKSSNSVVLMRNVRTVYAAMANVQKEIQDTLLESLS
mmetsp:Transcript_30678/g.74747  ORF Transcript_30678/g.74747 Transcript_30678/m.74747 type:complete len:739 (+) Transcript_30678:112-2328(+)